MANQSGSIYGLTLLCPILNDENARPSHDLQIRDYLSKLTADSESPFAVAPGTHLARLVVMDDVIYVGMPACEEHLQSKYLVLESNFDGDLDIYLTGLATTIPEHVDAIWSHCNGYPGCGDKAKFVQYMKKCQIETTFLFAAVNDKTITQTLAALQTQRAVSHFVAQHQGVDPAQTQRDFIEFLKVLDATPPSKPAANAHPRHIKSGGHNE
jgi:hypothetical protein